MKKLTALMLFGSLLSFNTSAEEYKPLEYCKNPFMTDGPFQTSAATTICGIGSTSRFSDATTDVSAAVARKNILEQGAQGAQQILLASSDAARVNIYNGDANVQVGFAQLASEGFQGSALDFANKLLNEIEKD